MRTSNKPLDVAKFYVPAASFTNWVPGGGSRDATLSTVLDDRSPPADFLIVLPNSSTYWVAPIGAATIVREYLPEHQFQFSSLCSGYAMFRGNACHILSKLSLSSFLTISFRSRSSVTVRAPRSWLMAHSAAPGTVKPQRQQLLATASEATKARGR